MVDSVSREERSRIMSRVRYKDTRPEMVVRRLVYGAGYRYRLHASGLPGRPDLVFAWRRKVIFVHGCFWHRHTDCALARIPKSNQEFWTKKLEGNRLRDERVLAQLHLAGWDVLVIWECELRDLDALLERIKSYLGDPRRAQGSIASPSA